MTEYFNKKMMKELEYYTSIKNNSRGSARILDRFSLTYKHISHTDLETLKKHYLLFPTSERGPETKSGAVSERSVKQGIHQAICADLSGAGVKIITSEKLLEGDLIEMSIAPPMSRHRFAVRTVGEVKRVSEVNTEDGESYCTGLSFLAIHENDREEITRYTFEIQQRLLSMKRQIRDTDYW